MLLKGYVLAVVYQGQLQDIISRIERVERRPRKAARTGGAAKKEEPSQTSIGYVTGEVVDLTMSD